MIDFDSKYTGAEVEALLDSANNKQDKIEDLDAIRSGAAAGASALQSIPSEYVTESELTAKGYATTSALSNKVDKVTGKGLSTEDFTTALKTKLESLSNYNDTEINNAVSRLQTQINTLVSGNANDAINSFNEIIAFLDGIKDTQDLASIIASIEQQIASKQSTISDLDTIRAGASKGATALQSYTEKYTGTITGIKMNGASKGTSGVVDLGTVITAHQDISGKQDKLVSGTNIKTINGYSILGSGNLTISGGGGDVGYSAKISLMTPQFNAVLKDSAGHYIEFTFDTTNGAGESMGEGVTCTYTITRGTNQSIITEKYRYNTKVRFGVDKYLQEGANDIVINIVGDISGLSTSIGVTFQVVNLVLDTQYDLSKVYDLSNKSYAIVEVPFTISGYGTKIMEWYVDGEALAFVKDDDEVVDVTTTRTKYITISNLAQGTHSLQVRAYTVVNGEQFFTDTFYYDMIVYTGVNQELIISVSAVIPSMYGVLKNGEQLKIYNAVQYETYTLKFTTYSPTSASSTLVSINVNNDEVGVVSSINGIENEFRYIPTTYGSKTLILRASGKEYIIPMIVGKTSMNIDEITTALALDFNASGRSNNSTNKDSWSFGDYSGIFSGFNWNETSGWANGRLEMNAGASFAIDYAPLGTQPTSTGKTIEIEWMTKNVTNDNAVICDLRGENGVGILITATKVSMTSADGVTIETEYKSDENVRVGFVINKSSGVTNQKMSFIYANGILSRGDKWATNDNYDSDKQILFSATNEAEVSLKSIRIYDIALTSDQMLNNYTLYRDTVAEMLEVYDRNDIYIDGTTTFSPDKMMGRLPVMIVTGDIPTLENTSDKDTQIVVDIEYNNLQNPSKSFKMKGAAMRPQGTSSMGYPKKNFRIYTQKVDGTVLYDANGNVVEDKLYAFTEKAQPVDCWCLKADYAESSGTHNTGIAHLWNDALINAQVEGEYVCRTEAQKAAIAAGYEYDVRTTIDGFPILLFYRPTEDDNVIFIGKYNFNNDKSTESVFGFKGIPNFNNEKMQCWEVLNNGNALALFTTTEGFDSDWSEAFESRYPDTKTPYTGDLKAFCEWMVNVSQEDFAVEKWEHLNVYMIAAYWCYLMRHAAADQFVKNAMFTSEDGQHFYYILYDNDTINGLINTGHLEIEPTDDRQTMNASGEYVFAGHDSRLWNMLEADEEFKNIVSSVDNALYSAGISYANTIKMFDTEQADKWVEKVYNQDAQYKYVGPYIEKGINNLFMLQGKRDLHRKWWLAKRFSIYDAKYVSGTYKSQAVELKCINGTPSGQTFKVTAGYPLDYGYGINNVPREFGIPLSVGESQEFTTREVVNRGDPIRIYGAPHIAELDLSKMASNLAVVTIANVYDEALGTKLTKLVVGKEGVTNREVAEISGLKQATALEHLDIQGMTSISSLDLSSHIYLKTFKAWGSGISSVTFAKGAPVERIELPTTMRMLSLEQLPYLTMDEIKFENIANLVGMKIVACPNLSNDFDLVYNWVSNKTTVDASCSLIMDGVNWSGVSGEQMLKIASLGTVTLKGKVELTDITEEQGAEFERVFGNNIFNENAEFYIDAPTTLTISGKTSLLEGESTTYVAKVYPSVDGQVRFSLPIARNGCSINHATGVLTTIENGLATSNIVVRAAFTPANGEPIIVEDFTVSVIKRTYPTDINIEGEGDLLKNTTFNLKINTPQESINGEYSIQWYIDGDLASYYEVINNVYECVLRKKTSPLETTYGTLGVKIVKIVDGSIVANVTQSIVHMLSSLTIEISSNQGNDDSINNIKASVAYGQEIFSVSSGSTLKIPIGETVSIDFPSLQGYSKPNSITYTTDYSEKTISGEYSTTIVKIKISDNQSSYNDVANAIATVAFGGTSFKIANGGSIKTPTGESCTITWDEVAGYSTPFIQTFLTSGTEMLKEGIYSTEILTIQVTADNGTPTGYIVSIINGISGTIIATQTSSVNTYKIPSGTSYYIETTFVEGFKTPSKTSTRIASHENDANNVVVMQYVENLDEILTVEVVGPNSGFNIYVKDSNGNTIGTQSTTSKTYTIEVGRSYYVEATKVKGFFTPSTTQTYTAENRGRRTIIMTYEANPGTLKPVNGFYYQDTDGYFHSSIPDSRLTINGVAVITSEHSFVMAVDRLPDTYAFGGYYMSSLSGVTYIDSEASAAIDYNGELNTTKVINALEGKTDSSGIQGSPAASAARNFVFPNGKIGYLGSAGEWQIIKDNQSKIKTIFTNLGSNNPMLDNYWTSTLHSTKSWAWKAPNSANKLTVKSRDSQLNVWPFCSI